jgi:hypothetical protein
MEISRPHFLVVTFFALIFSGCASKKQNLAKGAAPSCITEKITLFEKESCEKGANVKEYTFHGQHVFVFDQGTCGADMTSEVVDADCKSLGYLGGFTGNTKILEEDFSNAIFVKTTWEKINIKSE